MKARIKQALIRSRLGLVIAVVLHPRRAATLQKRLPAARCSFCEKGKGEVRQLITGRTGVAICDQCVRLCEQILVEEGITPR